jgi:hypothetical protein
MVLGAGYAVASDTASITVKVPGSTRSYQIIKNPDQCWGRDCYFSLVFLWSVQQYIGTSVFEETGASGGGPADCASAVPGARNAD